MNDNVKLIEKKEIYNLAISQKLFNKITLYCAMNPDTEWSGVLFYETKGSIDKDNLEITANDMVLLDIGSAGFTQFDMSPKVVSYMVDNPELMEQNTGLIHSHNKMSTFFSGTDISTLTTEGSERINFLSLIVNNAQKYCAKYTQKVVRDYDISYIDKVFIKDTFFKRKKVSSKNQITVVESWNLACVIPMQEDVDTMRKMQEEKSKPSNSFKGGQLSMFDGYDWGRNTAGNWSSTASNDHVMTSKSVEEIENDELEQFCKFIACGDCFAEESIEECLEKTEARIKKNPSFKDEYEWMVGDIIMDSLGYGLTPEMLGFDIKDAIKTLEKHKDKHPDLIDFLIESIKAYDYELGTTE